MKKGVARGIFSNEAGLGTGSIAHASSDVKDPVQQGLFGIFEVFIDTIVVCTMTALVILCSGTDFTYGVDAGAELTIQRIYRSLRKLGVHLYRRSALLFCLFHRSSVGVSTVPLYEFIFGPKVIRPFMSVYALVAILGATMDLGLLWSICGDI